jgi:hypothetical protein
MSGRSELRKTPPLCYNSAKSDVLITNAAESAGVRPKIATYDEGDWHVYREDCKIGLSY